MNAYKFWADGSVINNGKDHAEGGFGFFIENLCFGYGYIKPKCTNNIAEMMGVLYPALFLLGNYKPQHINFISDSKYVVDSFMKFLPHWKQRGFTDIKNPELWKKLSAVKDQVHMLGKHVRGHQNASIDHWENNVCDHLSSYGRLSRHTNIIFIDDNTRPVLDCHRNFYLGCKTTKAKLSLFKDLNQYNAFDEDRAVRA